MHTNNSTQHTPTPWAAEKCRSHSGKTFFTINGQGPMGLWIADINNDKLINGEPVDLSETDEANAKFIVRACNAHDELVDLLGRALSYVTETGSLDRMGNFVHDDTPSNRLCEKIRAALAKAKGEQ